MDVAKRLYPEAGPSFVEVLLNFPGGVEFDRDRTPMSDIDL